MKKGAAAAKRELATFATKTKRRRLVERVTVERTTAKRGRVECKAAKQTAKQKAAALREKRRALTEACRAASAKGRDEVAKARAALAVFRREERERIESERRRRPKLRRTSSEARQESDGEVSANIPPELRPVWRRVKHAIHAAPRRSRTEAFLEWVEANPTDVQHILWEHADADVEAMIAEYVITGAA